jgi:hypothetical protein
MTDVQQEASNALTSMATSAAAVLRSFVPAGRPAPKSATTFTDRSPTCAERGPTRKSSMCSLLGRAMRREKLKVVLPTRRSPTRAGLRVQTPVPVHSRNCPDASGREPRPRRSARPWDAQLPDILLADDVRADRKGRLCAAWRSSTKRKIRNKRKIRKKSVRNLLTSSRSRFKQRLKNKASEFGKAVLEVDQASTSKAASRTGEIRKIGGAKDITQSRDFHAGFWPEILAC